MLAITFRNISGLAAISDYEYEVWVNEHCIESGFVRNHARAEGWEQLVRRLLDTREIDNGNG